MKQLRLERDGYSNIIIQFLSSVEESLPYMQVVVGSNPTGTTKVRLVQGRFESDGRYGYGSHPVWRFESSTNFNWCGSSAGRALA